MGADEDICTGDLREEQALWFAVRSRAPSYAADGLLMASEY